MSKPDAVPLVEAALAMRVTYLRARDLVLLGELRGWRDHRRHWWVDLASLEARMSSNRDQTKEKTMRRV